MAFCRGRCARAGLLALVVAAAGCDSGDVQRRVNEIRERNEQNDRESRGVAARKVREKWLVRDGNWYGKLEDGSLVRLDAPNVSATPIEKGRPYCCKWLGEITVTADRWRTEPAMDTPAPFSLTYTVLVQDSSRVEFVELSGPQVMPPDAGEIVGLAAAQ
jgi:hypothetical protein